jgi:hypothetical protein
MHVSNFLTWGLVYADHLFEFSVWERPNYYSSPSIERSLDSALEVSGLAKEDIDLYDFYSYVPPLSVVLINPWENGRN